MLVGAIERALPVVTTTETIGAVADRAVAVSLDAGAG
jgi:hypothetical protein